MPFLAALHYSKMWKPRIFVLLVVLRAGSDVQASDDDCGPFGKALGMQSGSIPDSAITASSSYDSRLLAPHMARLELETGGGAWCPDPQTAGDAVEYLEVDLGHLVSLIGVATQGRFGNGQGQEWAQFYQIEYKESYGGGWNWKSVVSEQSPRAQVVSFRGNNDTYSVVRNDLPRPVITRQVRVYPVMGLQGGRGPSRVCMRVEFYGCPVSGNQRADGDGKHEDLTPEPRRTTTSMPITTRSDMGPELPTILGNLRPGRANGEGLALWRRYLQSEIARNEMTVKKMALEIRWMKKKARMGKEVVKSLRAGMGKQKKDKQKKDKNESP